MIPSGLRGRFVKRPYGEGLAIANSPKNARKSGCTARAAEGVGAFNIDIHNNIMVNQNRLYLAMEHDIG
jgi:hypothetical protein